MLIDNQLTPAGIHQRNWADRTVQTVKNHFIAGLCSTDPNLPLNLWYNSVAQSVITLKLLWTYRINTKLSAHAQVFGNFNYDHTPMDPPAIKDLLH